MNGCILIVKQEQAMKSGIKRGRGRMLPWWEYTVKVENKYSSVGVKVDHSAQHVYTQTHTEGLSVCLTAVLLGADG